MTNTKTRNSCAMTAVVTLFISFFLVTNLSYADCRPDILLLFFVNGALFYCFTLRALFKHPYSLELMFWIFMFYFMFFAPLVQYTRHDFPWGRLNDAEVWEANVLLFIFSICFILGTKLYNHKKAQTKRSRGFFITEPIESTDSFSTVLLMISLLILGYTMRRKGISGLFVGRSENVSVYAGENSSVSMLIESVANAFLTFATVYAICLARKQKGLQRYFLPMLQLLCLLLCCFPTTLSRNKMACIYMGLLLVFFPKFNKGSLFYWFFIGALIFLFPFMELFRYNSLSNANISGFFKNFTERFYSSYTEGHYDVFFMLGQTIRYVSLHGNSHGYQLLGSILFFVPRVFWPGKPIGSGATVAEYLRKDFTNVSCPLVAEGYINFGIIGVILFAFIVGYCVSRLDFFCWRHMENEQKSGTVYAFILPMFFFILRGDLLSSWAYTMGFVVTAYVLQAVYRHFFKKA